MKRLKISREGIVLIKSFEGFRPRAVRRDDGWVIGYGHTLSAREGATVSEADAELLLQYDLIPVAAALNEGVSQPLNQHQFDALASFAFSVGTDRFNSSDVLSRLNAGATGEAADALVGWAEPLSADAPLRRRAAERALFFADPDAPVALADLLAAPLPPPAAVAPIESDAVAEPSPDLEDEIVAPFPASIDAPSAPDAVEADAALSDAEADAETSTEDDAVVPTAFTVAERSASDDVVHAPEPSVDEDAASVEPEVSPEAADDEVAPVLDAEPSLVETDAHEADLTDVVAAQTVEPEAEQPAAADAVEAEVELSADPADPDAPVAVWAPSAVEDDAPTEASDAATDDAETVAETTPETAADTSAETPASDGAPTVASLSAVLPTQRYSPYAGAIVGPLPGRSPYPPLFPVPVTSATSTPAEPVADGATDVPTETPSETRPETSALLEPLPASGFTFGQSDPEPFAQALTATETPPETSGDLLVLTPFEAEPALQTQRLVWPQDEAAAPGQSPLFEDDGALRLGQHQMIRHELVHEPPQKFEWREIGAYLVMGAFGLVAVGVAMAAFRRASSVGPGAGDFTLIAWIMALVGAACVGVSGWNLYQKLGRTDD